LRRYFQVIVLLFNQNHTLVHWRVNKLDIKISEDIGNDIVIALDSTGIKVANRGEWMRHKWLERDI
jgi:hypothetical protein